MRTRTLLPVLLLLFLPPFALSVMDSDGDGIPDVREAGVAPPPGHSSLYLADSDGDGLPDGLEDRDRNGSTGEGETGTRTRDTDGDGYEDGLEVLLLDSDPTDIGVPAMVLVDGDSDSLPFPMDPQDHFPDTDGDRFQDGYEAVEEGLASASAPNRTPRLGDVNRDGRRDNGDSQALLRFFAGDSEGPIDTCLSDLNRDGFIDNGDAQAALEVFGDPAGILPVDGPGIHLVPRAEVTYSTRPN